MSPARKPLRYPWCPSVAPNLPELTLLEACGLERIAACRLPRLEPGHQPARALLRGAMDESVGNDIALAAALQPVVADGRRGLNRRFHIALLHDPPLLLGAMSPDSGEAIGL